MRLLRTCTLAAVSLLAADLSARAGHVYTLYDPNTLSSVFQTAFNNTVPTATNPDDNWVANSFQAVAGGEVLRSFTVNFGDPLGQFGNPGLPAGATVTASVYLGSSLTDPSAGGGLHRVVAATNTVPIAGTVQIFPAPGNHQSPTLLQTIPLAQPVTVQPGQVFYASLLIRNVPADVLPYYQLADVFGGGLPPGDVEGQSFFDVGPTPGAPYDLDNTQNATVLGGINPSQPAFLGSPMAPGTLTLNVNASAVPEPASIAMPVAGCAWLALRAWRRRAAGA
jgi:hypothetical protein